MATQKAYLDDHTLVNANIAGTQHNLNLAKQVLDWAQLKPNPPKCASLAFCDKRFLKDERKGNSFGPVDPKLNISGFQITYIDNLKNKSYRFLGNQFVSQISSHRLFDITIADFKTRLEKN